MTARVVTACLANGALVALVAVGAVGCSNGSEPSTLETPAIVWPDGEPTGPYEDSEWVKAIRARDVSWAVADSQLDYSDPTLVEQLGYARAQDAAESAESARRRYAAGGEEWIVRTSVLDGPQGRAVLDLFEISDAEVEVVLCSSVPDENPDFRTVSTVRVTRDDAGRYRVEGTRDPVPEVATKTWDDYQAECDGADIRRGYFDPPFEPNLDPDATVIGPADESHYDVE